MSQNCNILILTRNYPPVTCGVGDHSLHLANLLRDAGFNICIASQHQPASIATENIHFIPWHSQLLQSLPRLVQQQAITHIWWQYVPYSFHAFGVPWYMPSLMRKLQKMGCRQVVFFHEVALRQWGHGWRQTIIASLQLWIARSMQRFANTATSLPLYATYFKQAVPLLIPIGSNFSVKQRIPSTAKPSYFFAFANRTDVFLLQGFAAFCKAFPGAELVLAGKLSSQKRAALQQSIDQFQLFDSVTITGECSADELVDWVQGTIAVLHIESIEKGTEGGLSAKSGVLALAMQSGKAIISTKGDMTDAQIFQHGVNFHAIPFQDATAYSAAMLTIWADATYRQQLGAAAKHTYATYLSWQANRHKLIQLLDG